MLRGHTTLDSLERAGDGGALKALGLSMRSRKALQKALNRVAMGGWAAAGTAGLRAAGTGQAAECAVQQVDGSKMNRHTAMKYKRLGRPLVVRGVGFEWPARDKWRRQQFVEAYGGARVRVAPAADLSLFGATSRTGYADRSMTIRDYVGGFGSGGPRNESLFVFDRDKILKENPALMADFETPDFVSTLMHGELTGGTDDWNMISLGPAGEGVPFHNHGDSWLTTVYGRKRWFLYAPGTFDPADRAATSPFEPVLKWSQSVYAGLAVAPIECVTGPGDLMFLPEGWIHSTLNLEPTIGVGGQKGWGFQSSECSLAAPSSLTRQGSMLSWRLLRQAAYSCALLQAAR